MKKILSIVLLTIIFISCGRTEKKASEKQSPVISQADQQLITRANTLFAQLPKPEQTDTKIVQLGKKLYYETSISKNGKMSCNTCHDIKTYGVDNLATSPGHEGKFGNRNSPTTFNAGLHIAQFWDGRSPDLVDQAKGPVLNPVEMGMPDAKGVEEILKQNESYKQLFAEVFTGENQPITFDNFAKAVAAFEKTLVTPAPFDAFLSGKADTLTTQQKEGLTLFIETGCIACHTGAGLGGNTFMKFGLVKGPYWDFTHSKLHDLGKGALTGNEADNAIFKSSSLRNIQKTGPYFHDGSVASLEEAVKLMAYLQLGKELTPEQINSMVAFLGSLTGQIPPHAL